MTRFEGYRAAIHESARNIGVPAPPDWEIREKFNRDFPGESYDSPAPPAVRRVTNIYVPENVQLGAGNAALNRVGVAAYERDQKERDERKLARQTPEEWKAEIDEHTAMLSPEEKIEYLEDVVFRGIPADEVGRAVAVVLEGPAVMRDTIAKVDADRSLGPMIGMLARDARTRRIFNQAVEEGLGELSAADVRETSQVPMPLRSRIVDAAARSDPERFVEAHERGEVSKADFELAMEADAERMDNPPKTAEEAYLESKSVDELDAWLRADERERNERASREARERMTAEERVWEDPTEAESVKQMKADLARWAKADEAKKTKTEPGGRWSSFFKTQ